MICAQCGTPGEAKGQQRCAACRFPFGHQECPDCHASLFGRERFCPRCGSCRAGVEALLETRHMKLLEPYLPERILPRLLASESGIITERKYATVIFADISGYTAMSEELSPEAVSEAMNGIFEGLVAAVHRYDGTVDKFIGDAVMAIFGAPISHDNDPERAVYTALEMMSFLRERSESTGRHLQLSIGIHAGPLIAGTLGGHGRFNYTVMGDTVNTAQRLQGAAGPGRVLVSRDVHQRVKDAVRFRSVAPVRVKGKRNPIDVWEARERRPRSDSLVRRQGFVARTAEIEELKTAIFAEEGSVVALVGEAGVGRTALAAELARAAAEKGMLVVRTACPPYRAETSAGLFTEIVAQLLKVRVDQGPGAIKDGKAKLVELGLTEQEAALLLASASREKLDTADLGYRETSLAAAAAFLRVLRACNAGGGLLVILEDMQWASPSERAQLEGLLDGQLPKGVFVLLTMRPEAAASFAAWPFLVVELQPLTRADTGSLVAERLGLGVLEEALADKVFSVTHGNPRMIDELLQSFIDSGIIFRSRQRWIVSGKLQEAELPPGIEGLVSARIDELDADARRFVQAAAVVGTRFDPDMVRRVAGLQIDLEWVLSQLIDRRIVVADPEKPSLLRFAHETYRAVAEQSVPAKEKRFLHSRAGQYLEETTDLRDPRKLQTVAFHLAEGADHEKAAKVLLRAGRRLAEVHQLDDAVARLEKLVTLAAPLGYANYDLSRSEAELDEALYRLAMLYLRKGLIDEADERLQWAYGRSRHFFSGEVRVWSLFGLAELNLVRGRADEARKFLEMAAVDAEGMRDAGLVSISLLAQARLFNAEGNADQALEAAEHGIEAEEKITPEERRELPQPVTRPLLLLERAAALHRLGKSNDAQQVFEEAATLAEAAGDAAARGQAALALAKLAAFHRNYLLAQQQTGVALESFRSIGDRIGEGRAMHNFAIVALARGEAPKAQAALGQAEVIFAEIDHREGLALVAEARAISQAPAGAG